MPSIKHILVMALVAFATIAVANRITATRNILAGS